MATQNDRIQKNTPRSINQDFEQELRDHIRYFSTKSKEEISERIEELEKEWNMDRMLITNASSLAGLGLILGLTIHKNWFILPGVVMTFLLQHGVQGWCPPLPLFRKLGVRSFKEIDRERFALKYLRGDFSNISGEGRDLAIDVYEAVSK